MDTLGKGTCWERTLWDFANLKQSNRFAGTEWVPPVERCMIWKIWTTINSSFLAFFQTEKIGGIETSRMTRDILYIIGESGQLRACRAA